MDYLLPEAVAAVLLGWWAGECKMPIWKGLVIVVLFSIAIFVK